MTFLSDMIFVKIYTRPQFWALKNTQKSMNRDKGEIARKYRKCYQMTQHIFVCGNERILIQDKFC